MFHLTELKDSKTVDLYQKRTETLCAAMILYQKAVYIFV